ncbi:MAG: LysM peptidoglycan-binding domain-containing protein [Treponema sp.]
MAAKIGIKLADGTFFPIMDEDSSLPPEKLELTTVRDDQNSVQINLFKKEDEESEPVYIGSLIVEDIKNKAAGDPTIELNLSLDDEKNLSAEAIDVDSGVRQELKVSLETFAEPFFDDMDFDFTPDLDEFSADSYNTDIDKSFNTSDFYSDTDTEFDEEEKKRKIPLWLIIVLLLLGIAALVVGILLLTKKPEQIDKENSGVQAMMQNMEENLPVTPTEPEEPASETAVVQKEIPEDVPVTEPPTPGNPADFESKNTEFFENTEETAASNQPVHTKSVRYKVRWGDTLWDLSETYYRNPWLYTDIAKHNKLKNPDVIISGTYIEIPPQ